MFNGTADDRQKKNQFGLLANRSFPSSANFKPETGTKGNVKCRDKGQPVIPGAAAAAAAKMKSLTGDRSQPLNLNYVEALESKKTYVNDQYPNPNPITSAKPVVIIAANVMNAKKRPMDGTDSDDNYMKGQLAKPAVKILPGSSTKQLAMQVVPIPGNNVARSGPQTKSYNSINNRIKGTDSSMNCSSSLTSYTSNAFSKAVPIANSSSGSNSRSIYSHDNSKFKLPIKKKQQELEQANYDQNILPAHRNNHSSISSSSSNSSSRSSGGKFTGYHRPDSKVIQSRYSGIREAMIEIDLVSDDDDDALQCEINDVTSSHQASGITAAVTAERIPDTKFGELKSSAIPVQKVCLDSQKVHSDAESLSIIVNIDGGTSIDICRGNNSDDVIVKIRAYEVEMCYSLEEGSSFLAIHVTGSLKRSITEAFSMDDSEDDLLFSSNKSYVLILATASHMMSIIRDLKKDELLLHKVLSLAELIDANTAEQTVADVLQLLSEHKASIDTTATAVPTITATAATSTTDTMTKPTSRPKRSRRGYADTCIGDSDEDQVRFLVYPIEQDAFDTITITVGDLKRLDPGQLLNDNLIDFGIKQMLSDIPTDRRSKVHAFSCFFFTKLIEVNDAKQAHALVARWTKNVDIFDMDYILVPINMNLHWSLLVIVKPGLYAKADNSSELMFKLITRKPSLSSSQSTPTQSQDIGSSADSDAQEFSCILSMDSLNLHNNARNAAILHDYLREEWQAKKDVTAMYEPTKRSFPHIKCNVPMQSNGCDCGIYVIKYAELVVHDYSQYTRNFLEKQVKFHYQGHVFSTDEANAKRLQMETSLRDMQPCWAALREESYAEEVLERKKKVAKKITDNAINPGQQSAAATTTTADTTADADNTTGTGTGADAATADTDTDGATADGAPADVAAADTDTATADGVTADGATGITTVAAAVTDAGNDDEGNDQGKGDVDCNGIK